MNEQTITVKLIIEYFKYYESALFACVKFAMTQFHTSKYLTTYRKNIVP